MMQKYFLLDNGVNILYFISVRWLLMMKSRSYLFCILFGILLMFPSLGLAEAVKAQDVRRQNADPDQTANPAVKPKKPDTLQLLRLGLAAASPGTFDPHFAAMTQDRVVADMIFNGLVRYKPGHAPLIETDIAERFPESEIIDGKQVWTVKLRKGVMFHHSSVTKPYELTADDVVYSFQKASDPKRSAYAGEYSGMAFKKMDKYTVRIILGKPLSSILFLPKIANYAGGFIVSKKAVEVMGDELFRTQPVGTGPFEFDGYISEAKIRLKANKQYFRGRPLLDGVEVLYIPDLGDREQGLMTGELDVIRGSIETGWTKSWKKKGFIVDVHGVGQSIIIYFNMTKKPLNDLRVRRAIAWALDRDEFLSLIGEGVGENVYSIVPPRFLPGGFTKDEVEALGLDYPVNLEKARKLLAEAGYPEGFSLKVVTSELGVYRKTYKNMEEQLERIGVHLKVKVVDHSTMHKQIRQDVNPIVIYGAWRPNADVYLTRFFHSDSIVVTGVKPDTNFSHYDKIDDLIEAARLETDPGRQIELWKQAQIKILADMAAYPLHYFNMVHPRRNYVEYGHELVATMALYPQITEKTRIMK